MSFSKLVRQSTTAGCETPLIWTWLPQSIPLVFMVEDLEENALFFAIRSFATKDSHSASALLCLNFVVQTRLLEPSCRSGEVCSIQIWYFVLPTMLNMSPRTVSQSLVHSQSRMGTEKETSLRINKFLFSTERDLDGLSFTPKLTKSKQIPTNACYKNRKERCIPKSLCDWYA